MKLLLLFPSQMRGGAEEYTLTIGTTAAKQGWDVHAAFPQTDGTASIIKDFTDNNVQYHPLKIGEVGDFKVETFRKHLLRLTRTLILLIKLKPDVVQIVLPWPNLCRGSILASGILKIPTVVIFQLASQKLFFSQKMHKIYALARKRHQKWVVVSRHNQQIISESFKIPYSEILCIYNGAKATYKSVESCSSEDCAKLRYQVRQDLGVPVESKIALTVGRLSLQKGYQHLIQVIPHIIKEFPDFRFVWVGEGESRDYLINKVHEYGIEDYVLFLGYRSDVPDLLKAADIFVFPTLYEGQPFALLEAMAQGLPIVSSDTSGIPEIITDRVHGLLFRTEDNCELLEDLRWAIKNPEEMQRMAENAKLHSRNFFEEKMLKETFGLLSELNSNTVSL